MGFARRLCGEAVKLEDPVGLEKLRSAWQLQFQSVTENWEAMRAITSVGS